MSTVATVHTIVHRAMHKAHRDLWAMDLVPATEGLPSLNLHFDRQLPTCVYQPNTNTIAACGYKMLSMSDDEIRSSVYDAMAMFGCVSAYKKDMRIWNSTQNKLRLPVPAMAMHGGVKWRAIRSKL